VHVCGPPQQREVSRWGRSIYRAAVVIIYLAGSARLRLRDAIVMEAADLSPDTESCSSGDDKRMTLPIKLKHHPVVLEEQQRRANDIQLRIADWITGFAGSMNFVYLHIALFAAWMLFFEKSPWPTLTLIVSLEAIFLSTFVMIGQNRQAAFQQAKADHDFNEQELELKTNTQITREIHQLTEELHKRVIDNRTR
jgi:uncharacterized membrane protein